MQLPIFIKSHEQNSYYGKTAVYTSSSTIWGKIQWEQGTAFTKQEFQQKPSRINQQVDTGIYTDEFSEGANQSQMWQLMARQ